MPGCVHVWARAVNDGQKTAHNTLNEMARLTTGFLKCMGDLLQIKTSEFELRSSLDRGSWNHCLFNFVKVKNKEMPIRQSLVFYIPESETKYPLKLLSDARRNGECSRVDV